jgi:hypothetical protein
LTRWRKELFFEEKKFLFVFNERDFWFWKWKVKKKKFSSGSQEIK